MEEEAEDVVDCAKVVEKSENKESKPKTRYIFGAVKCSIAASPLCKRV